MKFLSLFLFLTLAVGFPRENAFAQQFLEDQDDFQTTLIESNVLSLRCNELNKRRQQKVRHKQRLASLIARNQKILDLIDIKDDREFYNNMNETKIRLRYEMELSLQKILNAEEALVRTGCPNLLLQ